MAERPMQHRREGRAHRPHHHRLDFVDVLGQQQRGEARRHGEGREQRSDQRISVGSRHRAEDLALDALHGEQRNERRDDDGGREKHRLVDLQGTDEDQAEPVGPALLAFGVQRAGRISAPFSFGQLMQDQLPFFRSRLEIPIDVLDQDHRGVDDDAEIDGADRQQVGVFVAQHQDDDAEEQRERNVDADDDGAAEIAQKQPLHDEDQRESEKEIVHDRASRHRDERRAFVKRDDLHPGRQAAVGIYLFHLRGDAGGNVVGVQRAVHHQDRRHHVVFLVAAGLAEPGHIADVDPGDVLDLHGNAVDLAENDVLDVADVVALGQIRRSAAVDQTDAADVDRLLADIDGAPAHVDVRVGDGADDLGYGDVVGVELVQVDFDLVFLGGAAPGVDLNDAGYRKKPALQDPVLDGAQIGQSEMRRSDHLVAIDLA